MAFARNNSPDLVPPSSNGDESAPILGSRNVPLEGENSDRLVQAHLNLEQQTVAALSRDKPVIVR